MTPTLIVQGTCPRNQKESGLHGRANKLDISLPAPISYMNLPMRASAEDATLVHESWPFILPHEMVTRISFQVRI